MKNAITVNDLSFIDQAIYALGFCTAFMLAIWFFIGIYIRVLAISRRYKIGKEIELAEEAKEVS